MLKKTKVFLASCLLLAGAINVQDAHSYTMNYTGNVVNDIAAAANAGNFAGHPSHVGTWYAGGASSNVQYLTDMGAGNGGGSINVTLSQDQLGYNSGTRQMNTADVSFTVWGANSLAAAGNGNWTQAIYRGNAFIGEPLGSSDLLTMWDFRNGNTFSVIGVKSLNNNMTITHSALSSWGGSLYTGGVIAPTDLVSDTKIEFDAISVPAPAAALVMLPGLGFLGMIAAGRRKNFDVA